MVYARSPANPQEEPGHPSADGALGRDEAAEECKFGIGNGQLNRLSHAIRGHRALHQCNTEGSTELEKGRLSVDSPLAKAILGAEEGDEIELPLENGRQRKALIESVEKNPTPDDVNTFVEPPSDIVIAVA